MLNIKSLKNKYINNTYLNYRKIFKIVSIRSLVINSNNIKNVYIVKTTNLNINLKQLSSKRSISQMYSILNAISFLIFGIAFGFLTIPLYRLFCQVIFTMI